MAAGMRRTCRRIGLGTLFLALVTGLCAHRAAAQPADDPFGATDWDSVFAAYDEGAAKPRPWRVGLACDKARGIHADTGAEFDFLRRPFEWIDLRAGYDVARERPTGWIGLRIGLGDADRFARHRPAKLAVQLEATDRARAFTQHDPHGNTLLALVGGYDARQYLRERRVAASLVVQRSRVSRIQIGLEHAEEAPLEAKEHRHWLGGDRWMKTNLEADRLRENGLCFAWMRRPKFSEAALVDGAYLELDGEWRGGNWFTGDREYGQLRGRVSWRRTRDSNDDLLVLAGRGVQALGDAPPQSLADLGGAAGLRAFPPLSFVGTGSLVARAEYERSTDYLRATGLSFLKGLGLHPVPFAEVGASWGAAPIRWASSLKGPRREDVHWDLGLGVRKSLGDTGIASHAQVDFAWPMGSDTGPVRVTFALSSDGLD